MVVSRRSGTRNPNVPENFHNIPGQFFIPQDIYNPRVRVEIDLHTGTTIDLSNYSGEPYVLDISYTRRTLNRGLGYANLTLDNPNGLWNNKITGGEVIRIYWDYTATPSLRWQGKIDASQKNLDSRRGHHLILLCRELPELQDKLICCSAENLNGKSFVNSVVSDWFSTLLTTTNLGSLNVNFYRDYVWTEGHKVLRDILNKTTEVGYIDFNNDIHTFVERKNSNEYINLENNCAAVNNFGSDLQNRRNNIITTGNRVESSNALFYAWSEKDASNISQFWQKDKLVSDSSLDSQEACETDCALALNKYNADFVEGDLVVVGGLPSLNPGESLQCSIPLCNINGWYQAHQIDHFLSPSVITANVLLTRRLTAEETLFDTRDEEISGNRLGSTNPYGMTNAFVVEFDESPSLISSFTNTEELNSTLVLLSGFSTGNAETQTFQTDEDITFAELRVFGEDLGSSYYQVSFDGGESYENINIYERHTVQTLSQIKTRVKLKWFLVKDTDNPNPKIWSSWVGVRFN